MNPDLYLRVREKEGRIYSDEVVARLPSISSKHALRREWRARSASASGLTRYLARQPDLLLILDLGCGNGWLANLLYKAGHRVIGMDQNHRELRQAARVFPHAQKLVFCEGDIFCAPFPFEIFDTVVLASVIQYFRDLPALLFQLLQFLKPHGEVHIIDSPIYLDAELNNARQRSQAYYSSLGFPEMMDNYFHHGVSDLKKFDVKYLYHPRPYLLRLRQLLGADDSPFPWVRIRKHVAQ